MVQIWVKHISEVDKPVKRSSKKKAKKKGKQYKKPAFSIDSIKLESVCKEGIVEVSVDQIHSHKDPACMDGHVSESRFSENATATSLSLQEFTMGNYEKDNSNYIMNHSAMPTMCKLYSDEVDESNIISSVHRDFTGEGCNQLVLDERSNHLIDNASRIQDASRVVSAFSGELPHALPKRSNNCNGISSDSFFDEYGAPVLGSFLDWWNSDDRTNCSHDIKIQSSIKEENKICSLHGLTSGKGYFPDGNSCDLNNEKSYNCYVNGFHSSNGVVDADNNTGRTKCGRHCCNIRDTYSVISVKRGRPSRIFTGSTSGLHSFCGGANTLGQTGKENKHCVWQKVQKSYTDKCICEPKNISPLCSTFEAASRDAPLSVRHDTFTGLRKTEHEKSIKYACVDKMSSQTEALKRVSDLVNSDVFLVDSENVNFSNKVSENLKRRSSSASTQEYNDYSSKGPRNCKTTLFKPTNINIQQKEASEILLQVNYPKSFSHASTFPCDTNFQRVRAILTDRVDLSPSEPLKDSQMHLDKTKALENVCTVASKLNTQSAHNQINLLSRTADSLDQVDMLIVQADHSHGPTKLEIGFPEDSKQDHNFGTILRRLVLVGRKDIGVLSRSIISNFSTSHTDESVADKWSLKCINGEQLSSTAKNVNCSSPKVEQRPSLISEELSSMVAVSECHLTLKEKDQQSIPVIETDSNKITEAVNDAYRLQVASESVQLATGRPLAEFERFLHCASPVLGCTYSVQDCKTCLGDQCIGDSLCRHQMPNISLRSIWQWYEKPGSYGLEVKAVEYQNLKRLGSDHFEFCAYFVPSLSAVQLFGSSGSSMNTSDMDKTPENSSNFGQLPIFSILLPKPHKEEDSCSSRPLHSLHTSELESSSGRGNFCDQSSSACLGGSELMFEYFESEQPQQRRPLYEMIKELIRGNATSNCQVFGDPLKLDCLDLRDLHPASWYSVAWYPIYRIPDGNFRAAFLTYHSLGHFTHKSASSNFLGRCIVSPVVGLQSYNAQGECWFKPTNPAATQTEGTPLINPSEILRERFRTLEQTASVMARASVQKGDLRSTNRQPDYEFFLSRRQ